MDTNLKCWLIKEHSMVIKVSQKIQQLDSPLAATLLMPLLKVILPAVHRMTWLLP
ncbi:MAG: hypothetical protein ACOX47_10960 [Bacillota bacterium]